MTPIPGTTHLERLEENVAAAEVALTADEMAAIDAVVPRGVAAGTSYPEASMATLDGSLLPSCGPERRRGRARVPRTFAHVDLSYVTDPTHVSSADPSATTGQAESERERSSQILLYDGLCGFCNGTVQFILRHDPHGPMRFAPLQGPTATAVLARHPELEDVDSLILVEGTGGNETISTHSDAVLRIGGYLGGIWASSTLLGLVPRRLRDWLYRLIARHRYSVFGRNEVCPKPPVEVRTRFLP